MPYCSYHHLHCATRSACCLPPRKSLASACSSTRAVYYSAFELEYKVTPREIAAAHDRANQDLKLFPSWPAKRAWHKRKAADD